MKDNPLVLAMKMKAKEKQPPTIAVSLDDLMQFFQTTQQETKPGIVTTQQSNVPG